MEEKSAPPVQIFGGPLRRLPEASGSREIAIGCGAGRPTYNSLRVFDRTRSSMPQPIDPSSYRSTDPQRPAVPSPIEGAARSHDPYATFGLGKYNRLTAGL